MVFACVSRPKQSKNVKHTLIATIVVLHRVNLHIVILPMPYADANVRNQSSHASDLINQNNKLCQFPEIYFKFIIS